MSVDLSLEDKIILITGGASGIGLSLAKQSNALGARIVIADLRPTDAFSSFAANKSNILFVQADVTRWADFNKVFAACEEKWNDVPDAYGICAGLFEPPFSNFWADTEEEGGYKQVAVNVDHPVKLTRMAIRKSLSRGKRASVCIIASIAGIAGNIAAPLYCATKHAVVGFTKSMKDTESITGVKVTTICPGLVNTPLITPDKMSQFSFDEKAALSPDSVAKNMLKLLQEKEYGCGTILELSLSGPRVIPEWNIPPPAGMGTGQELEAESAGVKAMLEPILKKLNSEKGSKL